jgi:hypothetical protein
MTLSVVTSPVSAMLPAGSRLYRRSVKGVAMVGNAVRGRCRPVRATRR